MPLVCVLGSGIIGLASATLLKEAGYDVIVVARDLPGDPGGLSWASPCAGAAILLSPDAEDPQMQASSFQYYWALAHRDPSSGVQTIKATEYDDTFDKDDHIWYKKVLPHYRRLRAEELPDGITIGFTMTTCAVNPAVILPWLHARLIDAGVRFSRFTAESLDQVRALTGASVVVNATGLGALQLAGDSRVLPVRGQTMFVRNKPEWNELVLRSGSEYTYTIPRMFSGGVIIGGSRSVGSTDTVVDRDLRVDILQRVNKMTNNAFADVDLDKDVEDIVGIRPGLDGAEFRIGVEGPHTVHAYGFGGMGYVYSFGAAKKVVELVNKLLAERSKL